MLYSGDELNNEQAWNTKEFNFCEWRLVCFCCLSSSSFGLVFVGCVGRYSCHCWQYVSISNGKNCKKSDGWNCNDPILYNTQHQAALNYALNYHTAPNYTIQLCTKPHNTKRHLNAQYDTKQNHTTQTAPYNTTLYHAALKPQHNTFSHKSPQNSSLYQATVGNTRYDNTTQHNVPHHSIINDKITQHRHWNKEAFLGDLWRGTLERPH